MASFWWSKKKRNRSLMILLYEIQMILNQCLKLSATDIYVRSLTHHIQILCRTSQDIVLIKEGPVSVVYRWIQHLKLFCNIGLDSNDLIETSFQFKDSYFRLTILENTLFKQLHFRKLDQVTDLRYFKLPQWGNHILDRFICKAPHIFIFGPPGSGKTSFLHGFINHFLKSNQLAISIEDPVEIINDAITQIQLNRNDLELICRSILRQRYDWFILGEIRDTPSRVVASQIINSGHVFITTLHANSLNQCKKRLTHYQLFPSGSTIYFEMHRDTSFKINIHIERSNIISYYAD